ncbi:MAG: 4Fe-4S binding protein [Clostridia bacterium]|nr:4Fe-4S binding protein [Clostridia bacterium]
MTYFHSVTLDARKCHGCTNCIDHCPTEAIRVRRGKAKIIKQRCIDCGECIRVCQSHAKIVAADDFSMLDNFKYNIAMPAPSFYSQFRCEISVNRILNAFIKIGFDDVFEVARGAEYISAATRELIASGNIKKPVISSACPAVLRLMRERFPGLLGNVLSLVSPMEAAAMLAREEARKKTGLCDEEIGVFFISPCPAKVTSIKSPLTLEKSNVSGAISVKDAFAKIRPIIDDIEDELPLAVSGYEGIFWARSGGECKGSGVEDYIAVDGINNVLQVLEEIEYGKVNNVEFIELSACTSGCSGGPLNIVNPFIASRRIAQQSKKRSNVSEPKIADVERFSWKKPVEGRKHSGLDDDLEKAMQKMELMDELYERLPKLDCGSCGAPSCKALAEDIVRGFASENDCIFIMREQVKKLAKELYELNESFDASAK